MIHTKALIAKASVYLQSLFGHNLPTRLMPLCTEMQCKENPADGVKETHIDPHQTPDKMGGKTNCT